MTRFELFDWVRYKNGDRIGMVMEVYGYSRKGSYLVWFPGLAAEQGRGGSTETSSGTDRAATCGTVSPPSSPPCPRPD